MSRTSTLTGHTIGETKRIIRKIVQLSGDSQFKVVQRVKGQNENIASFCTKYVREENFKRSQKRSKKNRVTNTKK